MPSNTQDPRLRSTAALPLVLGLAAGVFVGVAGDRLFSTAQHRPDIVSASVAAVPDPPPILTRTGDRMTVPPGSPLRERLAVAEPEMKEFAHTLVLPAMVEADPARTVKVLPAVAGRITELKVRLGERVTKDQELLIIDSGDLAQAYSDRDKARAQLILARKAMDRLMMLEKTQAISMKDRESAQNDFAQARSELERSENRLSAIG